MSNQHIIQFSAIFFTALTLGPALAHLLELPVKIRLPRDAYLTVQRIYRGWALLGVLVVAALISTLLLSLSAKGAAFAPALAAFLCIVATQLVFWAFTFPVNRRTRNWQQQTPDWQRLRRRWEYSHALAALLDLAAVACSIWAVLAQRAS